MSTRVRFAPSAAHRWRACPGSVVLEARYPQEYSDAAREGTAAHWYLSEALQDRIMRVGDIAPNGVPIDAEMIDCAGDALRNIRSVVKETKGALRIENYVSAHATIHADNAGTPDAYLIDGKTLYVWDYKYGHRYVDAFDNAQLLNYAAAILESEGVLIDDWDSWRIVLGVFQPRNYDGVGPDREWICAGSYLRQTAIELYEACLIADSSPDHYTTGDYCRDCSGRHACPALQESSMSMVDVSRYGGAGELSPTALGKELTLLRDGIKRMGARATGLEEQAMALLRTGTPVAGWSIGAGKGKTVWTDEADVIAAMGDIEGVDLRKPQTVITPTQAKKAGLSAESLELLSEYKNGALALAPFDINRATRGA